MFSSLGFLGLKTVQLLGSLMIGGMVTTASFPLGTTSVAGGSVNIPQFVGATTLSRTSNVYGRGQYVAYVTGTGSASYRYGAACFPSPLKAIGLGTGTIVRLTYHSINNPAGVGGDIGFVKSCTNHGVTDATASGSSLIDNVVTGTGTVSRYTTGTADWNGVDYIKFTPRANLTTSYSGRITIELEDNLSE